MERGIGAPLRIWTVAANTFREAARNRAFIGLMIGAAGFMLFGLALSELAIADQAVRVTLDYGLFGISLLGVIIAVVVGTLLLLLVVMASLAAVWAFMLSVRGIAPGADVVKAVVLCFFEAALVTACALAFSSFSTPVLSGVFAVGVFLVGRTAFVIDDMLRTSKTGLFVKQPWLRPIGEAILVVFPDLQVFNISGELLLGIDVPWSYVLASGGYAFWFIAALLAMAVIFFERRDLT